MPPTVRVESTTRKRLGHKLTVEEKERRFTKQSSLTRDLATARQNYLEQAKNISSKYGRSVLFD